MDTTTIDATLLDPPMYPGLPITFILDDQYNVVPERDPIRWARWFECHGTLTDHGWVYFINETWIGSVRVSTVFLGTRANAVEPPMVFETMVFGGRHSWYQERYPTMAAAKAGHERITAAIREGRDEL